MPRLVTTMLLKAHGFEIVRYVSLERLVEERKDEYYSVLETCSGRWHGNKNEIVPWWNFFLAVLRSGYREFERQVNSVPSRSAKSGLVRQAILEQVGQYTLGDLTLQFPATSSRLIKKVLAQLKGEGSVRLRCIGRGVVWEVAS